MRSRGRSRGRLAVVFALAAFALLSAVAVRVATESVPRVQAQITIPRHLAIPGRPPHLAWPREGEAAVEVEHLGSFGTSGSRSPVPIASVAKMMTAYLTLKAHPLTGDAPGFTMTVTAAEVAEERARVSEEQSVIRVRAGEQLTERQALEALLLPSANNVAAMLARSEAGSISAFVARMNKAARSLGMSSTHYTDPSGFDASTVSTASDQIKLIEAAMRNPTFASIVAERETSLPVAGEVYNYNSLVGEEGYAGVKTGSDGAAGGCLAFIKHIVVGGRRLTIAGVVLGQRQGPLISAALASAKRLGNSAAAAVRVHTALAADTPIARLTSADGATTAALSAHTLTVIGWPGLRLAAHVQLDSRLRTVRSSESLGTITLGGAHPASTVALARSAIGAPSLSWRLDHLL